MKPDVEKNKGGRPPGAMSKIAKEAREKALATGLLPHEILLSMARGEPQIEHTPHPVTGKLTQRYVGMDIEQRKDAAKAAAPYYAPKISTVEVIHGVSDDNLDAIIAQLAAEAGVDLGTGGEGEEGESKAPTGKVERVKLI